MTKQIDRGARAIEQKRRTQRRVLYALCAAALPLMGHQLLSRASAGNANGAPSTPASPPSVNTPQSIVAENVPTPIEVHWAMELERDIFDPLTIVSKLSNEADNDPTLHHPAPKHLTVKAIISGDPASAWINDGIYVVGDRIEEMTVTRIGSRWVEISSGPHVFRIWAEWE